MKRNLLVCLLALLSMVAYGESMNEKAAQAYKAGDYEVALSHYQSMLMPGEQSADVYYNMGNCYYRLGEMAQSILYYERALLLDPSDGDTKANLALAKSKCPDKIDEVGEFFPLRALHWLENLASSDRWAIVSILFVFLFIFTFLVYYLGNSMTVRKVCFVVACCSIILSVISGVFAYNQKQYLQDRNDAIIMAGSVTVRSTPSENGNALVVAHEGVKVRVISELDNWWEVRLPNGTIGWMLSETAERI